MSAPVSGNVSRKLLGLFTADWHVRNNDRIWSGYPDIMGDTSFALQQVVDICRQYRPPLVMIGGDQTHVTLQKSDAIQLLRSTLDQLCDISQVLFVQGNHCWSNPNLIQAMCPRTVWMHKRMVEQQGVKIYGLDFVPDEEAEAEIKQVPPCDILLTHQKWKEWGGGYGVVSMRDAQCKLLLNGDYHVRVEINNVPSSPFRAISPGPICIQRTDEAVDKYVYLIYDDLSFEAVPLRGRRMSVLEIDSEDKLNELLSMASFVESLNRRQEGVPETISRQIIVVKYLGTIPRLRSRLLAAARGNVHLIFSPKAPPPVEKTTGLPVVANLTLAQAAKIRCPEPSLVEVAAQLADADHPELVIDTLYEEWTR